MSVNVDEQFPKWRHPVWWRLLEEATVYFLRLTLTVSMDPFGNEDIAWLHGQVRSSINPHTFHILSLACSPA